MVVRGLWFLSVLLRVLGALAEVDTPEGMQSWVWETPGIYPSIPIAAPNSSNPKCRQDSRILIQGIKNRELWAMRMWDATPRATEGVLMGSMTQLGNYDSCLLVKTPVKAQYCMSLYFMHISPEFNDSNTIYPLLRDLGNNKRIMPRDTMYHGLCVPASCSADDMNVAINAHLDVLGDAGQLVNGTTYSAFVINSSCSTADQMDHISAGEAAFWLFCAFAVGISIVCSFIATDHGSLAHCLSLRNNLNKLFTFKKPAEDDALYVFHGIKMVSIAQVYFCHKIMSTVWVSTSHKLIEDATLSPLNAFFIAHADLPTDIFFFTSGTLAAFSFYKAINNKGMPNPVVLVLARFLRLAPTYYFAIWLHTVALDRIGQGPTWNLFYGYDAQFCKDNWWINLLLLSNYIKTDQICMTVSWYVNCDFHFFIAAVLLFVLIRRNEKMGISLIAVLFALTALAPGFTTYYNKYDPIFTQRFDFVMYPRANPAFTERYMHSHNRAAIFLLGMLYGIFTCKQRGRKTTLPMAAAVAGFLAAAGLMFAPALLGKQFYSEVMNKDNLIAGAVFVSLRRPLWGLGVAILLYVCQHRKIGALKFVLESKLAVLVSRLTYGIYILHLSLLIARAVSKREATSPNYFNVVMDGLADLFLLTIMAGVVHLVLDAPVQNLMNKMLFSKRPPLRTNALETNAGKTPDMIARPIEGENGHENA